MATLESLGLVGTIAEGDVVPVDSESDDSEDEQVGSGRRGRRGRAGAAGPGRAPCSPVLPQELRAPGPRRRGGRSRGDFSAEFVFGEAEAGGEDAWTAALRQLRSKVRPEPRWSCGARCSPGLLLQLCCCDFLPRKQLRLWMRKLRK